MAIHFKIDDVLPDDQHAEFRQFVLHRATTIDKAWAWLRQRGHKISRGAVHNWVQKTRADAEDPTRPLREAMIARVRTMTAAELTALSAHLTPAPSPKLAG